MRAIVYAFFIIVPFLIGAQSILNIKVIGEVDSLIKVCDSLIDKQNYDDALQAIQIAKWKVDNHIGNRSSKYANCIEREANIYLITGQFENAEDLFQRVKDIREQEFGKENPYYASSLNNMALLYYKLGKYIKAEQFYLEARDIYTRTQSANNQTYATLLNSLGNLYTSMGQYTKAEPLFHEAIDLRGKMLGKESRDYATSLDNLAVLYHNMGVFDKAELYYTQAKDIRARVLGKNHPDYALSLNNLATLYNNLGQYGKSEKLHLEAIDIRKKVLGENNLTYATSMTNLAFLYHRKKQYDKAEPLYIKAKNIRLKKLGKNNLDYALTINNLANLYYDIGKYFRAEKLYLEAINIRLKRLGNKHQLYAASLNSLANLYHKTAQYNKAELLLQEAAYIYCEAFGTSHPRYAAILNNLANLYASMGQFNKAEQYYFEASEIKRNLLYKSRTYLSENELADYLNTYQESLDQYFSIAKMENNTCTNIPQICYDNTLLYKGFLLVAIHQLQQFALSDTNMAKKYISMNDYSRSLVKEYSKPIIERDSNAIVQLEEKIKYFDKDLLLNASDYAKLKSQINWKEIQTKLQPEEVAIEFIHFKFLNSQHTDSIYYGVLVLLPGDSSPHYYTLFEENELKHRLFASSIRRMEYVANLYNSNLNEDNSLAANQDKTLYDLIWKPLESILSRVKTVYFSPSGLLHLINQNVISIDNKTLLSDKYDLVQLESTRQIVTEDQNLNTIPVNACLYGGVNFDMDSSSLIGATRKDDNSTISLRSELPFSCLDSTLREGNWKYLKGSELEINKIKSIFSNAGIKSDTYQGSAATEQSFKQLGTFDKLSPQIIHISTHGYFFPPPKSNYQSSMVDGQIEPAFSISEHPMMRSGLILAGANQSWITGKPARPEMEDGILTAYEISQLNLRNTELVVLSACESGLGDIKGNEGVYGLQRAFKIAGAKNLIMSLWQVPDKETSELMTLFYQNWLLRKMSIRKSLITAQNELRKKGLAAFYWAGFVLVK